MSSRVTRTKARIAELVRRSIAFAQKYPQVSVNTIAVTLDWTQSSLTRALDTRDMQMPETGRANISDLIVEAAMLDDEYATLNALKADIKELQEANTCELAEEQPDPEVADESEVDKADEDGEDEEDDEYKYPLN